MQWWLNHQNWCNGGRISKIGIVMGKLWHSIVRECVSMPSSQNSMTQEENLKAEERSKIIAGQQFENNRRQLHQSLREKQDKAAAKQRQGGCVACGWVWFI